MNSFLFSWLQDSSVKPEFYEKLDGPNLIAFCKSALIAETALKTLL